MHNVAMGSTDFNDSRRHESARSLFKLRRKDIRRNLTGPKGKPVSIHGTHLIADGSDVENQPKIFNRIVLRCRCWVDIKARERENSSSLPLLDGGLNLRGPHQIGLVGSCRPFIRNRHIVVRASDLVLGTVTATQGSASCMRL